MSTVTIEIVNLASVKRAFQDAPARVRAQLRGALQTAAYLTQRIEKQEAPVDTGYLRGSVDVRVGDDNAVIWPRAKYALGLVTGTGLYGPNHSRIYPKHGKILFSKKPVGLAIPYKGGYIVGRSSKGIHANDFVTRAQAIARPQIYRAFDQAVDNIIEGK